MNEARINPVASAKRSGELKVNSVMIQMITKLAEIGLNFVNSQLPTIREMVNSSKSGITKEQLEEFEIIASNGKDAITHFDSICQYMYEMEKKDDSKDNG